MVGVIHAESLPGAVLSGMCLGTLILLTMCPSLGLKLKAVQIFRELQVCFLGGLLAFLMLEEGGVFPFGLLPL